MIPEKVARLLRSALEKFGLVRELVIYNIYINDVVVDDDDDDIDGEDYDSFQGVLFNDVHGFYPTGLCKTF